MSSNRPDLNSQGYEIQRELGENPAGGRITYLATEIESQQPVVIKEFKFAQSGASWSQYDAHQREIELLRQLHHPHVPGYLGEFETETGFYLVQEYKQAPTLAESGIFNLYEIKQIAMGVLEILVYLQEEQDEPIFHRDIKPENILVDRSSGWLRTYLVDFGNAGGPTPEVSPTSAVKGTMGFMSPEQILKHPLGKGSDLYSLGATLICVLTQTKSQDLGQLIDENYRFNLKSLPGELSPQFIRWLGKMVQPKAKHRYGNAAAALKALKPMNVVASSSKQRNVAGKLIPLAGLAGLSFAASVLTAPQAPQRVNVELAPREAEEYSSASVREARIHCYTRKLMATGECENCDLSGIELKGLNLQGANLYRATLESAQLKGVQLQGANLNMANLRDAQLQGINLQGANLNMANLKDAQLQGINLQGAYSQKADFTRANLDGANLQGTNLNGSNLQQAYLQGANLNGASLQSANLEEAKLKGASLQHVNLRMANLAVAFLDRANFQGANLDYANLDSAYLQSAYLKDANLEQSNLRSVDLVGANLEGASLKGANLAEANLINANLQDANLAGANLQDADLRGANLKGVNLKGANLRNTMLPEGVFIR